MLVLLPTSNAGTTMDIAAAGSLTLCCVLSYQEEARMHAKATLEALWWQTNKTMDKIMNLSVLSAGELGVLMQIIPECMQELQTSLVGSGLGWLQMEQNVLQHRF